MRNGCGLVHTHPHTYLLCVPSAEGRPGLTVTNGDWYRSKLQEEPIKGEALVLSVLHLQQRRGCSLLLCFSPDYFTIMGGIITDRITTYIQAQCCE